MIWKAEYGSPIATSAVVRDVEKRSKQEVLEYFQAEDHPDGLSFWRGLSMQDRIFGLGEQTRGINKRGWHYESYATDDPLHTEGKRRLYGAHNFFIIKGKGSEEVLGAFFDDPGSVVFDFGYTRTDRLQVVVKSRSVTLYIVTGSGLAQVVSEFRQAIGQSYIPPLFAFGYQQSRWGYQREEDVKEAVLRHRQFSIPLDAVYLDIDYMERFKDFTIDSGRFPDMEGLIRQLGEHGVKLIPIIDAGVKVESGYRTYEEGVERGYFVKTREGEVFTGGVWPGKSHFPDVFSSEVRKWFGSGYQELIQMGAGGFWNDMNEPSLFYSQDGLDKIQAKAEQMAAHPEDGNLFLELQVMMQSLANHPEDYKSMMHCWDGTTIEHDRVHNLYGTLMTKAAAEALERYARGERRLLFSRSSYIGMHRYAGLWTGDNCSWWSHLKLSLQQMPSLNMCGFLYAGSDIGGFADDTTEDLMLRWLAFAAFVPLMRNHSALGTRRQEIYQFAAADAMRGFVKLRYRLIPYLYSEFVKAAVHNRMLFWPLGFVWEEDERALSVEDQLMVGESVMIAPVYEQNAAGRYVYLPEDMLLMEYDANKETLSVRLAKQGDCYIEIGLDRMVFFLRKGHLLPLADAAQSTEDMNRRHLTVYGYANGEARYSYIMDDGISALPKEPLERTLHVKEQREGVWKLWADKAPDGSQELELEPGELL